MRHLMHSISQFPEFWESYPQTAKPHHHHHHQKLHQKKNANHQLWRLWPAEEITPVTFPVTSGWDEPPPLHRIQ